jgi:hypothetical protein
VRILARRTLYGRVRARAARNEGAERRPRTRREPTVYPGSPHRDNRSQRRQPLAPNLIATARVIVRDHATGSTRGPDQSSPGIAPPRQNHGGNAGYIAIALAAGPRGITLSRRFGAVSVRSVRPAIGGSGQPARARRPFSAMRPRATGMPDYAHDEGTRQQGAGGNLPPRAAGRPPAPLPRSRAVTRTRRTCRGPSRRAPRGRQRHPPPGCSSSCGCPGPRRTTHSYRATA